MNPQAAEITTLTRNYRQLQGLRWVPVGLSCLVGAVVLGNRSLEGALWAVLVAAALVLVIGDAWIDQYYARAFGIVRHGPLWRRPGPLLSESPVSSWRWQRSLWISGKPGRCC